MHFWNALGNGLELICYLAAAFGILYVLWMCTIGAAIEEYNEYKRIKTLKKQIADGVHSPEMLKILRRHWERRKGTEFADELFGKW